MVLMCYTNMLDQNPYTVLLIPQQNLLSLKPLSYRFSLLKRFIFNKDVDKKINYLSRTD